MFNSICIYVTATSTRSTTPSQIKLPFFCSASPPLFAVSALVLSKVGSWHSSLLQRVHWLASEPVSWLWWDLKWLVLIFLQQLLICRKKNWRTERLLKVTRCEKSFVNKERTRHKTKCLKSGLGHSRNKEWKQPCPDKELCSCSIRPAIMFQGSTLSNWKSVQTVDVGISKLK